MILHIVPRARWEADTGSGGPYRADSLETEGFIHLSSPTQVLGTAERFFTGQQDLLLVCVDPQRLTSELRWEDPGEGQEFPHLYGPLELDAVVGTFPFEPGPDGAFRLPAGLPPDWLGDPQGG